MNRILVIADYSEQKPIAIMQAVNLAAAYEASLHIVYFCYESFRELPVGTDVDAVKAKVLATVELNAKAQLDAIDMGDVSFEVDVVWEKYIPLWVEQYVTEHVPQLVVKTGHRSETLFYTPTDWQLLRECQAPFMIVAEEKWRKARNVLATVDLGTTYEEKIQLNAQVLSQSKRLANFLGTEVYVTYTVPFSPLLRDLGLQYTDELEDKAKKDLEQTVAQLSQQYDIPVNNFHIQVGQPEKVIPSTAAEYKAGIVVIGTVGRKGIKGKLMGNTAEKILKLLKSDVLALKP